MPKNPKFPRTGSYVRSTLFPSLELITGNRLPLEHGSGARIFKDRLSGIYFCGAGAASQCSQSVDPQCQWEVGAASEALDRTAGFASIRRISRLKL